MSRDPSVRRRPASIRSLAAALVVILTALGVSASAGAAIARPSPGGASLGGTGAGAAGAVAAGEPTTTLLLNVKKCEGCKITAQSAFDTDYDDVWSAKPKKVRNGQVSFKVPTDRTAGLSLVVTAQWEGATGYATMVVMRYAGTEPGDRVGFGKARSMKRASACSAGTTEDTWTLDVKVKKVRVDGNVGRTDGTIAWTKTTTDYLGPMTKVWGGIFGTQEVLFCTPPA